MGSHEGRDGKRVDRVVAHEDHDRWQAFHPSTNQEVPNPGLPVLNTTPVGQLMGKEVACKTVICPECGIPARYEGTEPICPDCGMVCGDESIVRQNRSINDAKTTGRVNA